MHRFCGSVPVVVVGVDEIETRPRGDPVLTPAAILFVIAFPVLRAVRSQRPTFRARASNLTLLAARIAHIGPTTPARPNKRAFRASVTAVGP